MSFVWFLFMILVISSVIRRLAGRTGEQGKFDGQWGGPPSNRGDLPWRRTPKGKERESKPKLNLPEYLTRRSGQTAAGDAAAKGELKPDSSLKAGAVTGGELNEREQKLEKGFRGCQLVETAALTGCPRDDQKEADTRAGHRRYGEVDLSDDIICPREVMKGVIWSQILGPRGGFRAKKR